MRFRISGAADVRLFVYDGRGLRIRAIDLGSLSSGEHRADWDGRDDLGRLVPPEAYSYAIEAADPAETTVWDLAESTGGAA